MPGRARLGGGIFRSLAFAAALLVGCAGTIIDGQRDLQLGYVAGTRDAEDLIAIPGTRWIVTSGLAGQGRNGALFLIDRDEKTSRTLFPGTAEFRFDATAYPGCPGPLDPGVFSAHGISLRKGKGAGILYVMNHAGREAIEVFAIDYSADQPGLAWVGCVPLPPGSIGNGVAPLPDGRITVTLMSTPEYSSGSSGYVPKLASGETTGYAATWSVGEGWRKIPGTEGSGPNGIEASPDGRWVFVAHWGNRRIVRAPLQTKAAVVAVALDFMPDNVHWGDDGGLWIAGAAGAQPAYFACTAKPDCHNDYAVARLDPRSLAAQRVAHPETRPQFGDATAAIRIGDELWIASYPSDRTAYALVR